MRALLPFLKAAGSEMFTLKPAALLGGTRTDGSQGPEITSRGHRVLIVDDEKGIRDFCTAVLQSDGIACTEVSCGLSALDAFASAPFDLVLLDVNLPNLGGLEVLERLRETPPTPHLKIVMFSGMSTSDEMARMLLAGADDFLTKPFSIVQLLCRVKSALRLKDAQDRSELLNKNLLAVNAELENNLENRASDLVHSRNATGGSPWQSWSCSAILEALFTCSASSAFAVAWPKRPRARQSTPIRSTATLSR